MSASQVSVDSLAVIKWDELASHNSAKSAWLSLYGMVWDVTNVLSWHPGGAQIILNLAGKPDATKDFESHHARSILDATLSRSALIGRVQGVSFEKANDSGFVVTGSEGALKRTSGMPWVSVQDAENEARDKLPETSFAYFASGAEDETTLAANEAVFRRLVWFKPRVLIDVADVDMSRICFGGKRVSSPLFVCSTAIQGLADPALGELAAYRAARRANVMHMAAHLSSRPWEDYLDQSNAIGSDIPRFLQLYLPRDKEELLAVLDRAVKCGFEALFVTVDSPSIGKRERDVRTRQKSLQQLNATAGESVQPSGTAPRSTTSNRWNERFTWEALRKLQKLTKLPIVLKGIQRGDDAIRAVKAGVTGIMVSNHGGRNLDSARPSLACLVEINRALKQAGLRDHATVFFDGGVRRGGDILKALCLGADLVGIGRPILYGVAARGEEGALEVINLLHAELLTTMKIVGCTSLAQVNDSLVEYGISYL